MALAGMCTLRWGPVTGQDLTARLTDRDSVRTLTQHSWGLAWGLPETSKGYELVGH